MSSTAYTKFGANITQRQNMPLEWKPAKIGDRDNDCYADMPDGSRWMIRKTTFGGAPSFHLKLNASLFAICDTIVEAKQKAI